MLRRSKLRQRGIYIYGRMQRKSIKIRIKQIKRKKKKKYGRVVLHSSIPCGPIKFRNRYSILKIMIAIQGLLNYFKFSLKETISVIVIFYYV